MEVSMQFAEAPAPVIIPEKRKKPGLCYALAPSGLELPVIDLGHAAFALELGQVELEAALEEAVRDIRRRQASPAFLQKLTLRLLLRGSLLAKAVGGARGSYASGLGTYLLKLGPDNLGEGYAKRIDRAIASSLPCLSARLRLRDVASLLVLALREPLAARPSAALRIVAIAGGPAMDCLNALMALRREGLGALEGRRIGIVVLDRDREGPAFGARALAALLEEGSPLSGLDISMDFRAYDWNEAEGLDEALGGADPEGEITAISSEGGLFEYGSDEAISANLRALATRAPRDAVFVASMSIAEGSARLVNEASGAAIRFRSLEEVAALAEASGWRLGRVLPCPLSRSFELRRP
jgi:hypothetical protein